MTFKKHDRVILQGIPNKVSVVKALRKHEAYVVAEDNTSGKWWNLHEMTLVETMLRAQLADAKADRDRLAAANSFRMCVNCGVVVPSSHDRAQPGPGCKSPDACTFDLTPREAWEHWRTKALQYRADAQAAVALVVERAVKAANDEAEYQASVAKEQHASGIDWRATDWASRKLREVEAAIRALADADGLALVQALRDRAEKTEAQRDSRAEQVETITAHRNEIAAELAAAQQREASALEHVRTLVRVARGYQSMPGYLMHPMLADQCDRAALASSTPADTWHERRTMLPDGDARKEGGK